MVRRWRLIGYSPILYNPAPVSPSALLSTAACHQAAQCNARGVPQPTDLEDPDTEATFITALKRAVFSKQRVVMEVALSAQVFTTGTGRFSQVW
jgi:hypothetical protein